MLYLEDKHELRSVSCSIHCSDGRRYIIRLGGGGGGGRGAPKVRIIKFIIQQGADIGFC